MRIVVAAFIYFAIVFGAGFLFGTVPVLWLEQQLGPTLAVVFEAPFLLAVMVCAPRWALSATRLRPDTASLLLMGFGALALQQAVDFALSVFLRGISPATQLAQFATAAGLIYAALLLAFALMPLLLNRGTTRSTVS